MLGKIIENTKVILRPFLKDDMNAWVIWDNDKDIQRFLPEPHTYNATLVDQVEFFNECKDAEDEIHWTIESQDGGKQIGTISLTDFNKYHKVAELSIVIGEKFEWGRGFATASIDLIKQSLQDLGIDRLYAEGETENVGLMELMRRTGFKVEAKKHKARIKEGKRIDIISFYYIN